MHLSLHKPHTKALSIREATPFKNLCANTFDPLGNGCKLKDAHISFTCALYEVCRSIQEKSTNFKGIKLIVFVLHFQPTTDCNFFSQQKIPVIDVRVHPC